MADNISLGPKNIDTFAAFAWRYTSVTRCVMNVFKRIFSVSRLFTKKAMDLFRKQTQNCPVLVNLPRTIVQSQHEYIIKKYVCCTCFCASLSTSSKIKMKGAYKKDFLTLGGSWKF